MMLERRATAAAGSRVLAARNSMLTLTINGQTTTLPDGCVVAEAVKLFSVGGKRYAVERNGEIVPRSLLASTALEDGDRIEIVIAVGGG
jgi:sulfur carrier protein